MEKFNSKVYLPGVIGMAVFLGIAHIVYSILGYAAFGFLESAAFLIGILLSAHYKEPTFQGAVVMWLFYMLCVGIYFLFIA